MKRFITTALVGVICFALGVAFQRYSDSRRPPAPAAVEIAPPKPAPKPSIQFDREPLWAYGFDTVAKEGDTAPPQAAPNRNLRPNEDPAEQTKSRQARGSRASYSLVDVRDGHNVIDWFPQDHPTPMPPIIKTGPAAGNGNTSRGCGSCHLPNGKGRPENAPPAGLPVAYFMRQLQDFRNGLRRSADPRKPNTNTMIELAKVMTDEEMRLSAEYFGAVKWTPWIRVVESAQAPKVRSQAGMWIPLQGADAGMEPIGMRIIETPENPEYAEKMRSARSGFIAYVPVGSVAKGQQLVNNGDAARGIIACTVCHGGDLHGIQPNIPSIAARSPSYIARQLFDFQNGARNGPMGALMKPVVTNMTNEDFVNISAYLASRPAQAQQPTFSTASN